MCIAYVGHPISHGFVDCILQGPLSILHGNHLGSQRVHAEYIEFLSFTIDSTHVHCAVQPQHGANSGGGDSVLSCPRFCNDAWFAHAFRQQGLSDRIVDLVSTGVSQILTLQPDSGTTRVLCQTLCFVQWSRASHKVLSVSIQFRPKRGIILERVVGVLEFRKGNRKRFRNELSSELSKARLAPSSNKFLGNLSQARGLVLGPLALLNARGQMRNDFADRLSTFFHGSVTSSCFHSLQNGTAHHDSVSHIGYALDHLWFGNTKSYRQG
mmetsp:Transcript_11316/g.26221  ORF Transcript_11316/g.26221 Transcript_11316/m.26221 type:complete len:268 (+) Transcript_11316:677-1480(+)